MPTVSALWRWRQEYEEFRVILRYIMRFQLTCAT